MQVTRRSRTWMVAAVGVAAVSAAPAHAQAPPEGHTAGALLRVFSGSDHIAVRSMSGDWSLALPRAMGLALQWNHERVRIPAVDAPVGSTEAVDAITTASRPIAGNAYQDFVKDRDELQSTLTGGPVAVEYYWSSESDYLGQQLGVRWQRDVSGQLNLAVGTSYAWDAIAPLADDDTQAAASTKTTFHGNVVATQVLTPTTMLRAGVEMNRVAGLQHNPYRNVYAGGQSLPERHPDRRDRRDAFVRLHQYLNNRSSVKLGYRFYTDDWGIASHEADTRLSQYVTSATWVQYEYRWYTQGAADFHRDEYATADGVDGYRSGDYRMAALSSHLFGVSLHLDLGAMAKDVAWLERVGTRLSWERYFNSNNYSANILETGLEVRF